MISHESVLKVIESRDCMAILLLHMTGAFEADLQAFVVSLNKSDLYELDQYWLLLYQRFLDGKEANPYPGESCFQILKDEQVSFVPKDGMQSPSENALIAAQSGFFDLDPPEAPKA